MKLYQQRVCEEREELDRKRKKLAMFMQGKVYLTLPKDEQVMLSRQALHMEQYSGVLKERIDAFSKG